MKLILSSASCFNFARGLPDAQQKTVGDLVVEFAIEIVSSRRSGIDDFLISVKASLYLWDPYHPEELSTIKEEVARMRSSDSEPDPLMHRSFRMTVVNVISAGQLVNITRTVTKLI